jgi:hypothetical protein
MRLIGHAAWVGEMKITYKTLFRKPQGKRTHERPICKMDPKERRCGMNSTDSR